MEALGQANLTRAVPVWQSNSDYLADVIESCSECKNGDLLFPVEESYNYGGPRSSKLDDSARAKRRFVL